MHFLGRVGYAMSTWVLSTLILGSSHLQILSDNILLKVALAFLVCCAESLFWSRLVLGVTAVTLSIKGFMFIMSEARALAYQHR